MHAENKKMAKEYNMLQQKKCCVVTIMAPIAISGFYSSVTIFEIHIAALNSNAASAVTTTATDGAGIAQ